MHSIPDRSSLTTISPLAIVGARGKMGAWFTTLLGNHGLRIYEVDIETAEPERQEKLRAAKAVLFSVPISKTASVIESALPFIDPEALILDVTSLKTNPLKAMLKHRGEVLGLHPMCAPSEDGLQNQSVIACPGRVGTKAELFLTILAHLGAKIIEMDPERHDKVMAVVQGLHHFSSLVFAHALNATGVSVEESMQVASPVYELRMELVGRILAQNPQLYAEMELENPYIPEVLDAYTASLKHFKEAIEAHSQDACIRFITEAADSFGSYRFRALERSDELLSLHRSRTTVQSPQTRKEPPQ